MSVYVSRWGGGNETLIAGKDDGELPTQALNDQQLASRACSGMHVILPFPAGDPKAS